MGAAPRPRSKFSTISRARTDLLGREEKPWRTRGRKKARKSEEEREREEVSGMRWRGRQARASGRARGGRRIVLSKQDGRRSGGLAARSPQGPSKTRLARLRPRRRRVAYYCFLRECLLRNPLSLLLPSPSLSLLNRREVGQRRGLPWQVGIDSPRTTQTVEKARKGVYDLMAPVPRAASRCNN